MTKRRELSIQLTDNIKLEIKEGVVSTKCRAYLFNKGEIIAVRTIIDIISLDKLLQIEAQEVAEYYMADLSTQVRFIKDSKQIKATYKEIKEAGKLKYFIYSKFEHNGI